MKMGVPYSTANTVIEFEPDRRIAWQTALAGPLGRLVGGRIWRYEFEDVDGATKVTESWDITQDKQSVFLKHGKVGQHTTESMSKTLDRLAQITELVIDAAWEERILPDAVRVHPHPVPLPAFDPDVAERGGIA